MLSVTRMSSIKQMNRVFVHELFINAIYSQFTVKLNAEMKMLLLGIISIKLS